MKKQIKYLIAGAVVIVLLIVALLLTMKWIGPKEEESSSSANSALFSDSIYLNEGKTTADVSKITFKNSRGSFEVNKLDEENFMIDELKDTPYDSTKLNSMGTFGATFYASDTASTSEDVDLSLYGLNEPRAEITTTYADGSEFTILLGNDAPSDKGVYGKTPDSNNVYVFNHNSADPFLEDFTYLMKTDIAPDYEGYAYGYFKAMTVSGTDIGTDKPIVIGPNKDAENAEADDAISSIGQFSMLSHNNVIANFEYIADMLNTIFPTTAEEVIAVNPTKQQLADYGLDNPRIRVDLEYCDDDDNELTLTMAAGKSENGYVYITNEKSNVIYKIKEPTSDMSWTSITYLKIQNKLFLFPMLKSLDYIELTENGTTYKFDITATETTNDDGQTITNVSTTYDGKELDSDLFSDFFQVLIGMRKDRLTTAESTPSGTPEIEIKYHYTDTSKADDVIAFYPANDSDRHYHVAVNGVTEFDTLSYYIEKLKNDIQNLLNGNDINTEF